MVAVFFWGEKHWDFLKKHGIAYKYHTIHPLSKFREDDIPGIS
jgi:hypothetical protein